MPDSQPYGYWTYGGKNGLYGAESTVVTLQDGRTGIRKDPDYPAVLEDDFILWAVKNDKKALTEFFILLPQMDPVSQTRLNGLVAKYPAHFIQRTEALALSDAIQRNQVVATRPDTTRNPYLEKPDPSGRSRRRVKPTAYPTTSIAVAEGSAVSIQIPVSATEYMTTVTGLPKGWNWNGFVISGTAPQTASSDSYKITITRTNSLGTAVGYLNLVVSDATAPAPTIDSVTTGNQEVSIAIIAGDDGGSAITDYEYTTNGGGTWTSIGSTTSPLTITGLENGTSYVIQIRPVNGGGPGDATPPFTVIPSTVPSQPTISGVTTGDQSLTVSVTDGDDGGSAITDYEYSLNGGAFISAGTATSPFSITGLTNGTEYDVVVRPVNANGAGTPSAATTATPSTVPAQPTIDSITAGDGELTVTFTAGDDGGSALTDIEYTLDGTNYISAGTTTSPFTITGLTNGVTYPIQIRPVNVNGTGTPSTVTNATPEGVPSTAPTIDSFSTGDGTVTINFTPGDDGGSAITDYEYTLDGGLNYISAGTAVSPVVVSGLTNGTEYDIEIRPVNANGAGPDSTTVTATPSTVPDAPTLDSLTVGDGQLTVAFNGISRITGITQEGPASNQTGTNVMDAGEYGWISLDEQLGAGERLVLDNAFFTDFLGEAVGTNNIFAIGIKGDNWTNTFELNNVSAASTGEIFKGDTYLVGICNNLGTGVEFRIITGSTTGNNMSTTPSIYGTVCAFLEVTSSGNDIRLGFGRNGDLGVAAGDESTVTYADWTAYKQSTGDQGYGITSADVVMSFWTFDGGDIDGAAIDWTNLSEIPIPTGGGDGGSPITDYEYRIDGGAYVSAGTTTSPFVITGLANGTEYDVEIRAVNANGPSAASNLLSATPATTPAAPTISGITTGDEQLTVAFTAGSDGGSAITDYEYSLDGGAFVSAGTTTSPFTIAGLNNGQTYSVEVRAVNAEGDGASSVADTGTPSTIPDAPTLVSLTPGDQQLSVGFTLNGDGGSAITDVEYQINGTGPWVSAGTTTSPFVIGSLINGVNYTITVRAVNANGSSVASNSLSSIPQVPSTVPDAPTLNSVTSGDQQLTAAFTLGGTGGSPITDVEYRLNGGSWVSFGATSSPQTITGLTNGVAYTVEVRAVNANGASPASNSLTETPAASWEPTDVNTVAWVDASDTSSYTLSGSTLTAVTDKAGTYTLSVGGTPTRVVAGRNGLNTFDFDGSGEYLQSTASAPQVFSGNHWAIGVFRPDVSDATKDSLWSYETTQSPKRDYAVSSGATGSWPGELDLDALSSNRISTTIGNKQDWNLQSLSLGSWAIVVAYFNKAGNRIGCRKNGNNCFTPVPDYDNNVREFQELRLMRNRASEELNGQLAEFFAVAGLPGTGGTDISDIEKAEGYLAWKWGLVSLLPSGHPYKNSPP